MEGKLFERKNFYSSYSAVSPLILSAAGSLFVIPDQCSNILASHFFFYSNKPVPNFAVYFLLQKCPELF